jgi:hypothetical protein
MRTVKTFRKFSHLVYLILVLGVCLLPASAVRAQEEIFIGVSAPLTGDNAQYGEYFRNNLLLGMDQINANGGIRGAKLNLIICACGDAPGMASVGRGDSGGSDGGLLRVSHCKACYPVKRCFLSSGHAWV